MINPNHTVSTMLRLVESAGGAPSPAVGALTSRTQ